MKAKKFLCDRVFILTALIVVLSSLQNYAQFDDLLNHVKDKAKEKTEEKIDKTIDDATSKKGDDNNQDKNSKRSNNTDNNINSNNNDKNVTVNASSDTPSLKLYQNYDFVPGDTILFADDFTDDQEGEFPSHWSILNGQGMVNKSGDKMVFNLLEGNYAKVKPRMKTANYLGNAFTIEFDLFAWNGADCGYGANVFFTDAENSDNDKDILLLRYKSARADYFARELQGVEVKQSDDDFWNHWHHIAIAYKKPQMKVYLDQTRVLVLPDIGFNPEELAFGGLAGDESCPISFTNVRIASGGNMNMIGKKFTEAKIVTHGITSDIDKFDIKPESMGTLNMIVGVLKSNPDLKFEIDGHTDNTGNASHNLTLSKQRADAVKKQLVSMGIDDSRLTTKGFGDTKPMSTNDTPDGRANNRRVEFIRL